MSTLIANNSQTVSENIGFLYLRVSNKELFLFFLPEWLSSLPYRKELFLHELFLQLGFFYFFAISYFSTFSLLDMGSHQVPVLQALVDRGVLLIK